MVQRDSISCAIQPKNTDANKEYGRGNRARKQINYSDEAIDDQVLNITDMDDEENNNENDYTPVEVPRKREEKKEKEGADIDTLIRLDIPRPGEDFFEEEDN